MIVRILLVLLLCSVSISTFAKPQKQRSYGFFIASELSRDKKWQDDKCKILTRGAQFIYGDGAKINCTFVPTSEIPANSNAVKILDSKVDVNLLLWEDFGGDYHLYVSNAHPADNLEFKQEEWSFKATSLNWKTDLVEHIANILIYCQTLESVKKEYLNLGILAGSNNVGIVNGKYVNKETLETIDFETAYALYTNEGPKQKYYMVTALELGLVLGGGVAWYYRDYDFNAQDFQFGKTKQEIWKRFTTLNQVRFDDNDAAINRKHINAGVAYCLAARIAGMNKYECLLTSVVASTLWEYVVEYREVVSINDQILTPMSGFVLGNAFYEVAAKFFDKYNAPLNKLLSYTFGSSSDAQKWLAAHTSKRHIDVRPYGFDPDAFSYFDAGVGYYSSKGNNNGSNNSGSMWFVDSEILEIPLGAGRVSKIIDPGFVRLAMAGSIKNSGKEDFVDFLRVMAKIGFSGKYIQEIEKTSDGDLKGYNMLIIPGSGMEIDMGKYINKPSQQMDGYKDMIVNINVLGATARFNGFYKNLRFQVQMEGYGDFAMVKSFALEDYRQDHDMTNVTSLVDNQGYYYAGGVTGSVGFKMSYRKAELSANFVQDYFTSVNGQSRYKETERALDLNDSRFRQQYYAKLVTTKNLNFKCGIELVTRDSSVESISSPQMKDSFKSCNIAYSFW